MKNYQFIIVPFLPHLISKKFNHQKHSKIEMYQTPFIEVFSFQRFVIEVKF